MWTTRTCLLLLLGTIVAPSSHSFAMPEAISSRVRYGRKRAVPALVTAPLLYALVKNASPLMSSYNKLLLANPLATKLVTGGILALIGDSVAQKASITPGAKFDRKRNLSFAAFDVSYRGMQHVVFPWITKTCRGQASMGLLTRMGIQSSDVALWSAIESTLMNQLIIVPVMYYPTFYTVTALVQGLNVQQAVERAKTTFLPSLKRGLSFWLPLQFLQFRYVPEPLHIPVICLITLVWTTILSLTTAKHQHTKHNNNVNKDNVVKVEGAAAAAAMKQKSSPPTNKTHAVPVL